MAFPDNYEENTKPCGLGGEHQWSHSGHPLSHRCQKCHRPKWVEKKVTEAPATTLLPPVLWGS